MNQVIQNVSDTAFLVAGFRAAETEREKPLFRHPLAAKLAGDHGRNILATVPRSFVGEIRHISEEADRLGRPIPLPFGLRFWIKVANIFASRARRERMRRFAAYVLLTPK